MIGGRTSSLVVGGCAVLLLALAVTSGWQGATRLAGRGDATGAVQDAARTFAAAYGTFDAREADAYRARLLPLTTGRLRAALAQMDVDPAAVGQGRTLTTQVLGVQVTSLTGDRATADVTVDQRRRSVDLATGGVWEDQVRGRLTCRLVRTGGRWLVEEVRLVPLEPAAPPVH